MKIDLESGLLDIAQQIPSPNYDDRPEGEDIQLVVIHAISLPPNCFGGTEVEEFFCNQLDTTAHPYFEEIRDLQVSAHLLIKRNGEVVQFVPFGKRAWHAGVSSYRGRSGCNDFSIGIELEGSDESPYEEKQYSALQSVLACLYSDYKDLSVETVVGHCDISPGRKTDPGPYFEWKRLNRA